MRIAIITCYHDPDYIRARTLRSAAAEIDTAIVHVVANRRFRGVMRYLEVIVRTLLLRMTIRPDYYLLTFRGYEILLPIRIITAGKPLIYDEFINPIEWIVNEKRSLETKSSGGIKRVLVKTVGGIIRIIVSSRPFNVFYRSLVLSTDKIITDTRSHADVSANITGISAERIEALPVSTDEMIFAPQSPRSPAQSQKFSVLYYGNMLPLHGLGYVIEAARALKGLEVEFVLIGGNAEAERQVSAAIADGASITYKSWVPFAELPSVMNKADVCLAGPFGGTFQARYVITGKAYQFLAMAKPTMIGKNEESHVFSDKQNALLVEQASADSIVEAVRWSLDHRQELERIGKNGRTLYEKQFSNHVLSTKLRNLLADISTK